MFCTHTVVGRRLASDELFYHTPFDPRPSGLWILTCVHSRRSAGVRPELVSRVATNVITSRVTLALIVRIEDRVLDPHD